MNHDARQEARAGEASEVWPSSWLYVPAIKPSLFDKAVDSSAEALILDLEDAVPQPEKAQARQDVAEWLIANGARGEVGHVNGKPIWVRINAEHVTQDVAALAGPDGAALCAGVILAKAEPEVLETLHEVTRGALPVIGLVESAAGLKALDQMAAFSGVETFGIGEVDLLADLRMRRSSATTAAVDVIRLQVVMACAAAGLRAPLAPTSTDFRDLDAFAETTRTFQDLGFRARTAIHPGQCTVINTVFTPTAEDIDAAQRILDHSARASGGVALDDAGRLIDAAVVRGAAETLERAAVVRERGTADARPEPNLQPGQGASSSTRRN